ncbi:hypothetical protein PF005_g19769 [Phytophthora fragariae]|uniref:HAT C-terminal dimerisation domain-containing protein n=1 Tax=Phytophthora fragariae TaxID=53985 RepID=A0A6A4BYM7_9STRA|nr:hypothetical protein PF003_g38014 [Phytophthora fragariae]KAE8929188.1 hypothetical protein PF009_g20692 [Phytophthora fragariae]KAE9088373.1 hypothetical protein PF007_g19999 [Phytophthora fragariae]KAE9112440.1 hypothetical protein PF006_g19982 [Phytophthora fragariae]KAE9189124.1 hypothetical protein PF005_g19769 [Phytophthora fragariae]
MIPSFPTLHRLIRLVCGLPVSTAETQRSFSAMTRLKPMLRTTMREAWMSDLLLLSIDNGLSATVDHETILNDFRDLRDRRILI